MSKENNTSTNKDKDNYNTVIKELKLIFTQENDIKELIQAFDNLPMSNTDADGIKIYPDGKWELITCDVKTSTSMSMSLEDHVGGKPKILRPAEDIEFIWNVDQEDQKNEKNIYATTLFMFKSTRTRLMKTLRGNVIVCIPT